MTKTHMLAPTHKKEWHKQMLSNIFDQVSAHVVALNATVSHTSRSCIYSVGLHLCNVSGCTYPLAHICIRNAVFGVVRVRNCKGTYTWIFLERLCSALKNNLYFGREFYFSSNSRVYAFVQDTRRARHTQSCKQRTARALLYVTQRTKRRRMRRARSWERRTLWAVSCRRIRL
jgi:hypothetical protein